MKANIPELGSRDLAQAQFAIGALELPQDPYELSKCIIAQRIADTQASTARYALYLQQQQRSHAAIHDYFCDEITEPYGGSQMRVRPEREEQQHRVEIVGNSEAYGTIPPVILQQIIQPIARHVQTTLGWNVGEESKICVSEIELGNTHPVWMTFAQVHDELVTLLGRSSIYYNRALSRFTAWQKTMRQQDERFRA